MKGFKKGIAIALALATAFTFAPVSQLGLPVIAEAAAQYNIDGTVSGKGSSSLNRQYTADSSSSGYYKLTASAEAWRALNVSYTVKKATASSTSGTQSGSSTTTDTSTTITSDTSNISLLNGDTFVPVFSDANKGLNGTYVFTLTYTGDANTKSDVDKVTYTITLSGSTMTGVTAATLTNIKQGSAVLTSQKDQLGGNETYELTNGLSYDVTFAAPSYKTDNSTEQLTASNTDLQITFDGNSVQWSDIKAATNGGIKNEFTLTAAQPGKTTVTATWKATAPIGSAFSNGDTISTVKFTVNVPDTSNEAKVTYQGSDGKVATAKAGASNTAIALDTIVNRTEKINVANASSTVYFVPQNPNIANVSSDGTVTAVARGTTNILVYIGDKSYTIPVNVSDVATDKITAQVNGEDVNDTDKAVDLDLSNSTAATAVKTAKINFASQNGLTSSIALYTSEDATTPVAGNANNTLSVLSDGTISAGTVAGTVYLKITSATDSNRKINGGTKWIKVTVNSKPQAALTINTSEIRLDIKSHNTVDIASLITNPLTNVRPTISVTTTDSTENKNVVTISGNTIKANQIGVGTLLVTLPDTATTRSTTKSVKVSVVEEITKSASDLTVTPTVIELERGGVARINAVTAVSGSTISYTTSNQAVATVDNYGNVTATTVASDESQVAQITVTASGTDSVNPGQAVVTVVVKATKKVPVEATRVSNVKVKNAKGAKVTVTWDSQGGNILYRVYKKVGNAKKWSGKNVTSAKASLSVKKGAKVQVKVKAYYKDENGKTHWGPSATKAPTFTTDKK